MSALHMAYEWPHTNHLLVIFDQNLTQNSYRNVFHLVTMNKYKAILLSVDLFMTQVSRNYISPENIPPKCTRGQLYLLLTSKKRVWTPYPRILSLIEYNYVRKKKVPSKFQKSIYNFFHHVFLLDGIQILILTYYMFYFMIWLGRGETWGTILSRGGG